MVEIQGFSKKQQMLADIIWALDSQDQVQNFIKSLPTKDRMQAEVVTNMIVLAFFDQVDDTEIAHSILVDIMCK